MKTLKYLYSQVNYAGKIQRVDDQLILEALIEDLFSEEIVLNQEKEGKLDPDVKLSHYGIPEEYPTFSIADVWLPNFPDTDPIALYGFNFNIQRAHFIAKAKTMIDKLVYHESQRIEKSKTQGESVVTSIEMNSQRTSLESSNSAAEKRISSMLTDETSMLNLFIGLQKLLASSSLDLKASEGAQRYD